MAIARQPATMVLAAQKTLKPETLQIAMLRAIFLILQFVEMATDAAQVDATTTTIPIAARVAAIVS